MASLVYPVITSLDGYVVDADGSFDCAEPDEEVHAFVNASERALGTYLLGRRLYVRERPDSLSVAHRLPRDAERVQPGDLGGAESDGRDRHQGQHRDHPGMCGQPGCPRQPARA
jgi:hypothetical protein